MRELETTTIFPMGQMTLTLLDDRAVLQLGGVDARAFLQNIVTNDVTRVSANRAVWAALLSPQGKYLHDFFVLAVDDALMLDCEAARVGDLAGRLKGYKLRSKVEIDQVTEEWAVAALMGTDADAGALVGFEGQGGPFAGGVCYVDPRYGGLGAGSHDALALARRDLGYKNSDPVAPRRASPRLMRPLGIP